MFNVFLVIGVVAAHRDCTASDANLLARQGTLCASLACSDACPCHNMTGAGDWPNQAVYMKNVLTAIVDPDTCLETATAKAIVSWLSVTDPKLSAWWWTWVIFQLQYYDMPRKPGARIESPATLGRKCWAFAFLRQKWPALKPALLAAVPSLGMFASAYDKAVPLTVNICHEVMANCFVNASYEPSMRNGTCPDAIGAFYTGYAWENGNNNAVGDPVACPVGDCWRNDSTLYPFPRYGMSDAWRGNVEFAVNTALNMII